MRRTRTGAGKTKVSRQVALLRGINVGRAKRVAMADLRQLVEELGYRDVRTLLNSGNVVFTASTAGDRNGVAARIEKAVEQGLGVSARVTVLSDRELAAAVSGNPLQAVATDPSRLLLAFLRTKGDRRKLDSLAGESWAPEVLAAGEKLGYLWCPLGIGSSPLFEAVNRLLGDSVTTRNWATVIKLHALTRSFPGTSD